MITCLNNLIGMRGLADKEDPDSGYFLNDLHGITTDQLEAIGDDTDQYEARLAWDDIYDRSSRIMESDIKTAMNRYYKGYSYKAHSITGALDVKNVTLATEAFYSGWYFDLVGLSPNQSIVFETATIHVVTGSSFSIKVFDALTGEQLFTEDYTATAGLKTYRILQSFPLWKHRQIFVAYDATAITVKQVDRFDLNLGVASANHVSTSASVVNDNLTASETGMMLNYNVSCSLDNFVCQRIDLFTNPFLYKMGIEFCNERIYSDRINRWTLMDKDEAIALRDELKEQYDELLDNIFRDIRVEENDDCFECAKDVTYKVLHP